MLGRAKDVTTAAAGKVKGAVDKILGAVQNSVPVQAVDVAYDQATNALNKVVGGDKGKVMKAINAYRNLAKAYPKTAGFAKAALVAITALATSGAGLPIIAGLTYGLDSAIKGDRLSTVLGKGGGAAALAWAGQQVAGALKGSPADAAAAGAEGATANVTGGLDSTRQAVEQEAIEAVRSNIANGTIPAGDIGAARETAAKILDGSGMPPQAIETSIEKVVTQSMSDVAKQAGGQATLGQAGEMAQAVASNQPISVQLPGGAMKFADQAAYDAWQNGVQLAQVQMPGGAVYSLPQTPVDQAADVAQAAAQSSAPIDYTKPGPVSVDSMGQKLEYGIPVNDKGAFVAPNPSLPPEELAQQTAAYNAWKQDYMSRFPEATLRPDGTMQAFKPGLAPMFPGGGRVQEAIEHGIANAKLKVLPADELIDHKLTVMGWALNESVGKAQGQSLHLTKAGVNAVFANINRVGRSIVKELRGVPGSMPGYLAPAMPDAPGKPVRPGIVGKGLNWLDKAAGKVGGWVKSAGHELTTGVTQKKLQMLWHQGGKPTDSDALARWLQTQKVPAEVVAQVYQQMGIPEPGQIGTDKPFSKIIKPGTDQYYTRKELDALQARQSAPASSAAAEPVGKQAAATPAAPAAKPAAPAAKPTGVPGYDYKALTKMPGMEKLAQKKPDFSTPSAYGKTTYSMKPPVINTGAKKAALAMAESQAFIRRTMSEVKQQLAQATTKEDVNRIKSYIDREFVRNGLVNESYQTMRDNMIRKVVTIGAQRRREAASR
jgi:hypothetical protein